MLWLCVDLHQLPLDALNAPAPEAPLAVAGPDLVAVNEPARALGLKRGMSVRSAYALAPALTVLERRPAAEAQALEALAGWSVQFTPRLSLLPPTRLLLEIEGSLKLFGGTRALKARFDTQLADLGYAACSAIAATPTAAALLARAGMPAIAPRLRELLPLLDQLPLYSLELPDKTLAALQAVGLRSCGDCLRLPRTAFVRRHGKTTMQVLDRLTGARPDPREPWQLPPRYSRKLELGAETDRSEALLFISKRLFAEFEGYLRGHDRGVLRLRIEFGHAELPPTWLNLGLARPSRSAGHLLSLFREHLHALALPAPVRHIGLKAHEFAELSAPQSELLPSEQPRNDPGLIERLAARLGPDSLCAVSSRADHRPERASMYAAPGSGADRAPDSRPRPLWLLEVPQPIKRDELELLSAPERIETGWWDEDPTGRDYHQARSAQGQRLWVYRAHEAPEHWYVHGIFG